MTKLKWVTIEAVFPELKGISQCRPEEDRLPT